MLMYMELTGYNDNLVFCPTVDELASDMRFNGYD